MSLPSGPFSISAVERDTGLSKDLLRVWERRYGFPMPSRDAFGERQYPADQLERLRLIRRLIDAGHRPGRIVTLTREQLLALAAPASEAASVDLPDHLAPFAALVRGHRVDELRSHLAQALLRLGLERFVTTVCVPLNRLVGQAWVAGELQIFEEHLYTESMQVVLRGAIAGIPLREGTPRVLLTTFPGEQHGLGLLMAEALMALDGAQCLSLGVETPILEIARAAQARHVAIVALSFSSCLPVGAVVSGLQALRAALPDSVEIWAGGANPGLSRRSHRGVQVLTGLDQIRSGIQQWRRAHQAEPA